MSDLNLGKFHDMLSQSGQLVGILLDKLTHTIGTEFYQKWLQLVNFNSLQTIFDECTPKFVNTMHSIELEYRTEKNKKLLVFVRICRMPAEKAVLKSAMYDSEYHDLEFLQAYFGWISSNFGCLVCNIKIQIHNQLIIS